MCGGRHSKFSHVTNTDKHPKGIAASLLEKRVNAEMNGKACMEIFPNSTLYNDNKVLEALLNGDVQLAAPSLSKFEESGPDPPPPAPRGQYARRYDNAGPPTGHSRGTSHA